MSLQFCPFFPDDENHLAPLTLAFATDTSAPQEAVPIHFIHSLAQPFCDHPGCLCQQQRQEKAALLASIISGALTLRQEGDKPTGSKN